MVLIQQMDGTTESKSPQNPLFDLGNHSDLINTLFVSAVQNATIPVLHILVALAIMANWFGRAGHINCKPTALMFAAVSFPAGGAFFRQDAKGWLLEPPLARRSPGITIPQLLVNSKEGRAVFSFTEK
jgi:hypothetical protein